MERKKLDAIPLQVSGFRSVFLPLKLIELLTSSSAVVLALAAICLNACENMQLYNS